MAAPSSEPLVSYVILSYNYENYIKLTLDSILRQSEQDFDIVVVDDCSKDSSREVVRSYSDPRVRLLVNDKNMGGAWSFNRAVRESKGKFIATVDADDWIEPTKTGQQLAYAAKHPDVDIIGTWVNYVDADGERHPQAELMEAGVNVSRDMNLLDTWVVQNMLCRSSTLTRRRYHDDCGVNEPSLVHAADYELWTRAVRNKRQIAVVPERLTNYRLHTRNITHANAEGTLLEISYLMTKNVAPTIADRALYGYVPKIVQWVVENPASARLTAAQRYRLLGSILIADSKANYDAWREYIIDGPPDARTETVGRHVLTMALHHPSVQRISELERDNGLYMDARDWWRAQALNWEEAAKSGAKAHETEIDQLRSGVGSAQEARDWWRKQAESGGAARNEHTGVLRRELERLQRDNEKYIEARDWWREQAEKWRGEIEEKLSAALDNVTRIRDTGGPDAASAAAARLGNLEAAAKRVAEQDAMRDWFRGQLEAAEKRHAETIGAYAEQAMALERAAREYRIASDWWRAQAEAWERECARSYIRNLRDIARQVWRLPWRVARAIYMRIRPRGPS